MKASLRRIFTGGGVMVAIGLMIVILFILSFLAASNFDQSWGMEYTCTHRDVAFGVGKRDEGCAFSFCNDVPNKLGTSIKECYCGRTNSYIYLYCDKQMPLYTYKGTKDEIQRFIISYNNTHNVEQ